MILPPDHRPTRLRRHARRYLVAAACLLAAGVPFVFSLDDGRGGLKYVPAGVIVACLCGAFLCALAAFDA